MTSQINVPDLLLMVVRLGRGGGGGTFFVKREAGALEGGGSRMEAPASHLKPSRDERRCTRKNSESALAADSWKAWLQFGNRPTGMVVGQPANRDTGAGNFFPFTCR